ncbi:hypothetical protein [Streptomyces sp. NPDC046805]|uniref:hypothetical protein n=1 Tax=Streptomyces sp. NPDC046805 TaxID=3155134 RepID=UPI003404EA75
MSKLVLRVASAATSVLIAGGALLAGSDSASAATVSVNEHVPRVVVAENSAATDFGHRHLARCDHGHPYRTDGRDSDLSPWSQYTHDSRFYPWVYDQLTQSRDDGQVRCHVDRANTSTLEHEDHHRGWIND